MTARSLMMASRQAPAVSGVGSLDDVDALPLDRSAIRGRRGWDLQAPWRGYLVGGAGHAIVRGEELDRFELDLDETGSQEYYGYLRAGTELTALPIGSHVDQTEGRFTWTPGVGFVGAYDLVFVRAIGGQAIARQEIRIILAAKGSGRLGPQVVIDTPGQKGAAPSRAAKGATGFGPIVVEQPFMLAGWATDLDAETGTGIDTLHVWAYPATGAPPVFLGVADQGGSRRDVAALHGEQFRDSAYGMLVQGLRSGDYDLAVFAWSNVTGGFVPAQIVRVRVP